LKGSPVVSTFFSDGDRPRIGKIIAKNNFVYLLWGTIDNVGNINKVFLSRSTDGGATFSVLNLNPDTTPVIIRDMEVSGNNVHVVWSTSPPGARGDTIYTKSTNNGATFSTPTQLDSDPNDGGDAALTVFGNNVYVTWSRDDGLGNRALVFRGSTDNGNNFSTPTQITNFIQYQSVNVYISFWDVDPISFISDVFFMRSTNNGIDFSSPENKSNNDGSIEIEQTQIVVSENHVFLSWGAENGGFLFFLSTSTNNGDTFATPIELSDGQGQADNQKLEAFGDDVYALFEKFLVDNQDMFLKVGQLPVVDSDGDGYSDGDEVNVFGTNPLVITARIAAIFAQFTPNVPAPTLTQSDLDQLLDYLSDYYDEISYGKLELQTIPFGFNEIGWNFSVDNDHDFYGGSEPNCNFDFVRDAITESDQVVNFDNFDMVIGVHSGPDQAVTRDPTDMWSCFEASTFTTPVDGEIAQNLITISEESHRTVWAHEIGHGLGQVISTATLPDLYDKGNLNSVNDNRWDLMGVVRVDLHMSSFTRELLNWLDYSPISFGTHIVRVLSISDDPTKTFELPAMDAFYILETRSRTPDYDNIFDAGISSPDSDSFVIYRVDNTPPPDCPENFAINVMAVLDSGDNYQDPLAELQFDVISKSKDASDLSYTVDVTSLEPSSLTGMVKFDKCKIIKQVSELLGTAPPEDLIIPDLDLHAFTPDGAHVGINFFTGEYENTIPGAIASGDLINDEEWIFVPSDIEASFVVSSKDNLDLLSTFPELNQFTDGVESFTLTSVFFDDDAQRHTSDLLDGIIPAGGEQGFVVSITQNPDGTITVSSESSLRALKQGTIFDLESIGDDISRKNQKKIDKALKLINESLEPTLWIDDTHLEPKQGKKVIHNEEKAVKKLMKVLKKDNENQLVLDTIQSSINQIVEVDRNLAQIAIDDAQAFAGDKKADKEIDKALEELAEGDKDASDGKFDKAIHHYEKAWKHAQKAMKIDVDDDDDDDEEDEDDDDDDDEDDDE